MVFVVIPAYVGYSDSDPFLDGMRRNCSPAIAVGTVEVERPSKRVDMA